MRDLNKIAKAGQKKLIQNSRRDLLALDYIQLVKESNLKGSDELFELINKVYAAGFEEGFRAGTNKAKIERISA